MEKSQPEPIVALKLAFPTRPVVSKNFKAKEVKLMSNHFTVSLSKNQEFIYLYSIKIVDSAQVEIDAQNRDLVYKVFNKLREKVKEIFGINFWFSGKVLWSVKKVEELKTLELELDGKKYFVVFKKTKDVSLKPESFTDYENAATIRQYINILIKRFLKNNKYVEWGTNAKYYDPKKRIDLNDRNIPIEIWTGYKTSCEVYQNLKLKIQIDFSSRILRTDSVLDYMKTFRHEDEIYEDLIGRSVVSSYGNFRMWRITDIDFRSNPGKTFRDDQGHEFTLIEYYKNQYNIIIKDKKQPLLIHQDKRKKDPKDQKSSRIFYLIPELMRMTGLTDEMRNDYKVMKEVGEITRLNPKDRMNEIYDLNDPLYESINKDYGITIASKSEVTGFQMTPPTIITGKGEIIPDKGNFQLRQEVFKATTFSDWILAFPANCKDYARDLVETLQKCSGSFGIKVQNPYKVEIGGREASELRSALKSKVKSDTQIVVCLYPPAAKKGWYRVLKEFCYMEAGIPCQAVVTKSLEKNAMSVCSKILIQMLVKIGNAPWVIRPPVGLPERVMIIGADVYHKIKVGKEIKSCVGFCASLDSHFSKFFSKVSFQKPGQELMEGVGALLKEAVTKYFIYNGKKFLPDYILFYRDGVSEGQIKQVLEFETSAILKELMSIDPNYKPKFAEIIVTKRISDRIFAYDDSGKSTQYFNPSAGTVVTSEITSNYFDYFLVPQNVTQGSCTPTRFEVIYDNTGLTADIFYQLTFYQCYNYYNWTGGIRVPSVVMYAHKLAYLVGQTVKGEFHPALEDKQVYL